jgi:hypothetical protein
MRTTAPSSTTSTVPAVTHGAAAENSCLHQERVKRGAGEVEGVTALVVTALEAMSARFCHAPPTSTTNGRCHS